MILLRSVFGELVGYRSEVIYAGVLNLGCRQKTLKRGNLGKTEINKKGLSSGSVGKRGAK